MKEHGLVFPIALFLFQVLLIGLFGGYVTYDSAYEYRTKNKTTGVFSAVDTNQPKKAQDFYTCKYWLEGKYLGQ